jgi:hypothetical protein
MDLYFRISRITRDSGDEEAGQQMIRVPDDNVTAMGK